MDCGMLLSPRSRVCQVCGFDNNYDARDLHPGEDSFTVSYDEVTPENYPGF